MRLCSLCLLMLHLLLKIYKDYEEDSADPQESETNKDLKIVVESGNDDAIILEESDDQVANQNRVNPAYVDSDDEEDFINCEDQFVEFQNANEMTGPDYADSEDEFVEDQNICLVDQDAVNSKDRIVPDQNSNEVAGPEYLDSEDEFVERSGFSCSRSRPPLRPWNRQSLSESHHCIR